MTDRLPSARALSRPQESWRARLVRSLLYGRNVDRAAKARARVGFVMLAFVAIYAVIGGRLVMFATGTDSHGARRGGSQDAIATARPDIVDRNGESSLAHSARNTAIASRCSRISARSRSTRSVRSVDSILIR